MKPLDAVWLMMESSDTPMHVGVLATFRKPRKASAQYVDELVAQLRQYNQPVAPWSCRLDDTASTGVAPRMVQDAGFELAYHFRHSNLPQPGGERELGVVVSQLHSEALDRRRPLWELNFIAGLENNRFALYLKVHHAVIDNINAIPLLFSWLSPRAKKQDIAPFWTRPLDELARAEQGASVVPGSLASVTSIAQAASGFLRHTFKRRAEVSVLQLFGTPRSTLNRRISAPRRFATQQFSQVDIEALAQATDSTVEEILAYLCGSSLRRFFKEYNALPEQSLIGSFPVSLAERSERLPGNAIAGIRVLLGTHIGDPLARLAAIKTSIQEVRADRASLPKHAVGSYVMMRSAPTYASQMPGIGRFVPPMFNLGISNTPGLDKTCYLGNAPLEAIYPLSPLMQFSALSIDCVSYAGTYNIGFTGAQDTLPHLQRLAVYTGKAVAELQALVATKGVVS